MNAIDLLYQSALQQLSRGEWQQAADTAQLGIRSDPNHGGLWEIAGMAACHLEEYPTAIFRLETAVALIPLGAESQLLLAELYWRFGQILAAKAILAFLAESGRCPVSLLPELAKNLGRAGEYELAIAICERLTLLRPRFHPAWFGVAYYLGELGRPAHEVELPLRQAFHLAPGSLLYRVNLATILTETRQWQEAYALAASIPVEAVVCSCQCQRLAKACFSVGDDALAACFLARAESLSGAHQDNQ